MLAGKSVLTAMPYFDAVSKVDSHELSNAVDQANREVAMRRHPEVEHPEIAFEPFRIDSPNVQRGFQIGAAMQPLAAGSHFEPPH